MLPFSNPHPRTVRMAPDLNSLPPSRSPSDGATQPRNFGNPELLRRQTPSPSPRSSSVSLAAAATINAGMQNQDSRRSSISNRGSPIIGRNERRRSNVMMSLNFNDPSIPGPGELQGGDHRLSIGHSYRTASPHSIGGSPTIATGDPHHQRAPSLGEIHQELEQEQEAQVVRCTSMTVNLSIRTLTDALSVEPSTSDDPPAASTASTDPADATVRGVYAFVKYRCRGRLYPNLGTVLFVSSRTCHSANFSH